MKTNKTLIAAFGVAGSFVLPSVANASDADFAPAPQPQAPVAAPVAPMSGPVTAPNAPAPNAPANLAPTPISTSAADLQSNSSAVNVAAPTVVQNNSQNNSQRNLILGGYNGEQPYARIGNIACASTNLYVQTATQGQFGGFDFGGGTQWAVSAGINVPLGQGDCRDAQKVAVANAAAEEARRERAFTYKEKAYCADMVAKGLVDPDCERFGITRAVVHAAPPVRVEYVKVKEQAPAVNHGVKDCALVDCAPQPALW